MGGEDGCEGGWRPLSGLICEIVNSVGQGNFTFFQGKVRERSGNFKHLWLWQLCLYQIKAGFPTILKKI